MKPKLYQYAVCPFCCKVKGLLNYKGIAYESIEVNPMNKKEIAFSEYKKVPIYVDETGKQINDSTEIMRAIDAKHPERKVFSGDEKEETWLKWSSEVFVRALPPVIYDSYRNALKAFSYITKEGNFGFFQRYMAKFVGAFIMTMVAKKSAKKQNIKNPKNHLRACLKEWEDGLSEDPNGADIAVYGILNSIADLPAFAIVKENEKVYSWYKKLEAECN